MNQFNFKVTKRDGKERPFDITKIERAILKAMKYSTAIVKLDVAKEVARVVAEEAKETFEEKGVVTVYDIEDFVFYALCDAEEEPVAKNYTEYKTIQSYRRSINTTDESILSLVAAQNTEVMNENSNKNATIIPTQRDLIAGEISKDLSRRLILPTHIVQAHDDGILHYHDMDYTLQKMFNCCLVDIENMLGEGTVINGKMVESPKSFQTACTITTQIIAQISSAQYGGQSLNIKHLGKYLRISYNKYYERFKRILGKKFYKDKFDFYLEKFGEQNRELIRTMLTDMAIDGAKALAKDSMLVELEAGVQTIQYQINTLMTTNGQSPFVTLFLEIEPGHEYEEEISLIVNEVLKQRLKGIKNEKGVYVTPSFPKLVYVLDENNIYEGSKYRHITELAAKCTAKRLYPDYISAPRMRAIYEGNVFSPMGCRSFLSPWIDPITGEYKFEGRFNMGVVSLNLAQLGILAKDKPEDFWSILDARLELCYEALMIRYNLLKGTLSDVSPIHWQHGALARLEKGETIDKLLVDGYATISLGYIGLYELTKLMTGNSHTKETDFALTVMDHIKETVDSWKEKTGLGFGLYGTPAESLCHRFAKIDKSKFGEIEDITDKGYYTNSYHVDVREHIDAFAKLKFEAQFQPISTGGCISYVEIPNMNKNMPALIKMIEYIYKNIQYAEFNTKSDYCHECSFDGEIILDYNHKWTCPICNNQYTNKMNITRRTCGYLGDNLWNEGKTKEIKCRVLHVD